MRRLRVTLLAAVLFLFCCDRAAYSAILYAVDGAGSGTSGDSFLYVLDPLTGSVIQTVGSTGFTHVTGLAVDPTTGSVYGYANDVQGLIAIDKSTGAGTLIGTTGEQVPDITFSPTGQLYAWTESSDSLLTIDKTTGAATHVGISVGTAATGLGFDRNGTLYLKPGGTVYELDLVNNTANFLVNLDIGLNNALVFDTGNTPFSILRTGGDSLLETINLTTGTVTQVGATGVSGISALAFDVSSPIPEPASLLITGTGLFALLYLRRRYAWNGRR